MERRKVLAAISAAIAAPARAWRSDPVVKASEGLQADERFEARRHAGLTDLQKEVREFMASEIETYLENLTMQPGPAPVVDLWVLHQALINYCGGGYMGEFCGLLNAIEETLGRDRRFVAVPEALHSNVDEFIEGSKDSNELVIHIPSEIAETALDVIRHLERHADIALNLLLSDDSDEPGEGDLVPIKRWNIPARSKAVLQEVQS